MVTPTRERPRARISRSARRPRGLGIGIVLGLLGLAVSLAPGANAETESWGYSLAHELMSPYCPGRTLAACTSGQAAELRQWILLQEAAGASREEVVSVLEQRFGDVIRSSPEPEGWGLAAWLLPGAVVLLGALVVVGVLRSMVAKPAHELSEASRVPSPRLPTGGGPPTTDAEIARLVDEELAATER
jgi:cytochrome c-type biogenesis protein CcmH